MQHLEEQQQLARATSMPVVVVNYSTFCVPAASRPRQRAHLHLCSHRTMRTDSAAVESLAARAIHVAGTASSGQAAVPVSGTVG